MSTLAEQSCQPVAKGSPAMTQPQIDDYVAQIPRWQLIDDKALQRDFAFINYYQTMAFVNAVAFIAHQCDHHPDMQVGYNHCCVTYTTHAVAGLSMNDFICAAKIDTLPEIG